MSYEYMQGMLGLGQTASKKPRMSLEEANDLLVEKCGGIGCVGMTTQPVIFRGDDINLTAQIVGNMAARGCFFQCKEDDVNYYCCPPRERETPVTREARMAAACGGGGCVEPGMMNANAARTDSVRGQRTQQNMLAAGCIARCEEDGWAYFCCPSDDAAVVEPVVEEIVTTEVVAAPVQPESSFPWGVLALLGVLTLGAGFAGYWFLLREDDEDEEDES